MKKSILVIAEHLQGKIVDITYEMLGIGRKIADSMNVPLYAAIFGNNVNALASTLGAADKVFVINNPKLEIVDSNVYADLIKSIFEQNEVSLVLIGGTNLSSGVGSVLSHRLSIPYLNFCKDLRFEDGSIISINQLFGGKIISESTIPGNTGIISIYPGSLPADQGKSDKQPVIEEPGIPIIESKIVFKRFIEPEPGDIDVTKEKILVAVGRGIENSDNISLAEELSDVLSGALCASRPVIDQGWLPLSRQIGKSGMIVKPQLYIALGISGAPEHVEGMKDSELIISVNKDLRAPIFNISHYGVCADLNDFVTELNEQIKIRKS